MEHLVVKHQAMKYPTMEIKIAEHCVPVLMHHNDDIARAAE